jgi:hypothetical protein
MFDTHMRRRETQANRTADVQQHATASGLQASMQQVSAVRCNSRASQIARSFGFATLRGACACEAVGPMVEIRRRDAHSTHMHTIEACRAFYLFIATFSLYRGRLS